MQSYLHLCHVIILFHITSHISVLVHCTYFTCVIWKSRTNSIQKYNPIFFISTYKPLYYNISKVNHKTGFLNKKICVHDDNADSIKYTEIVYIFIIFHSSSFLGLHNIITLLLSSVQVQTKLSFLFIYEYITLHSVNLNWIQSAESAERSLSWVCRYFCVYPFHFLYQLFLYIFWCWKWWPRFSLLCWGCRRLWLCLLCCIDNYLCILMYTLDIRSCCFLYWNIESRLSLGNRNFFPSIFDTFIL